MAKKQALKDAKTAAKKGLEVETENNILKVFAIEKAEKARRTWGERVQR